MPQLPLRHKTANSFTEQEVDYLCVVLKSRYNLTATKQISGYYVNHPTVPQYNIYIHAHSVKPFNQIVYPYIIPSMRYKLI